MNFADIPPFNSDLTYEFSIHFEGMVDESVDENEPSFYNVRSFQHIIPDATEYARIVDFLTTDDDIDLYDNPSIGFQDEMEGLYHCDLGIGDSGVDHQFIRFETSELDDEAKQLELTEKWREFFIRNGFRCGDVVSKFYTEEEYDAVYE